MVATLGIDLGTSGVRAVVLGHGQAQARAAMTADVIDRRDPAALWAAVQACLAGLDLTGVTALAVAGTSGSVLAVAAGGMALSPIALYRDGPSVAGRVAALRRVPGVARVLHEADWVSGQFSGRFDVSDANNALKTGYDPVAGRWSVDDPLLPRVVPPGTVIGPARGLPEAVVVAGTTDGCAGFLSTGARAIGDAVTSLGSTLTLKVLAREPVVDPARGVYSHRLFGMWLAGGASNAGGAVLARYFTAPRIAELSASIDPARESGLDYYPLLTPGERFPVADPSLRPRLEPRPGDDAVFLHGLLEGLASIEATGYAALAELGAERPTRVLSVGGGAGNSVYAAIRARKLGVPVIAIERASAALGAAMVARGGLDAPSSDESRAMVVG